jgi:hypothetical protein
MKKNKIVIILTSCIILSSCQSVKDGLTGNKTNNNDEFLVQKKSPLVLPPKYLELPKPKNSITQNDKESLSKDDFDIEKMLGMASETKSSTSTQSGDAEELVLKNIKNN